MFNKMSLNAKLHVHMFRRRTRLMHDVFIYFFAKSDLGLLNEADTSLSRAVETVYALWQLFCYSVLTFVYIQ